MLSTMYMFQQKGALHFPWKSKCKQKDKVWFGLVNVPSNLTTSILIKLYSIPFLRPLKEEASQAKLSPTVVSHCVGFFKDSERRNARV